MAIRARLLLVIACLSGLVACASLVSLDESDPVVNASSSSDGGATSSGNVALDGSLTTEAGVTISSTSIDFQRVACGVQQTQTITVHNDGNAPTTVTVSIEPNDVFTLADATNGSVYFSVAAHEKGSFTIQAKSSKAGTSATDVVVKIGDEEHRISVKLDTAGGSLAVDPAEGIDFGQIKYTLDSEKQKVTFRNEGNDPITVTEITGLTNFKVYDLPFPLAAGASIQKDVQMLKGDTGDYKTETGVAKADGLCGAPQNLVLKGQRVDALYTVNPSTVEFGDQSCGATNAQPKTITISNYTGSPKAFTFKVKGSPSAYAATAPALTVPAMNGTTPGTAVINVTLTNAGQVPGDLKDTIEVDLSGDVSTVNLHATVKGALLTVDKPTMSLNRSGGGTSSSATLKNEGNVNACVQYTRDGDTFISEEYQCGRFGCSVSDETDQVNAGSTTPWSVRYFYGSKTTTITAKLIKCSQFGSVAPQCGTLPKIVVTPSN